MHRQHRFPSLPANHGSVTREVAARRRLSGGLIGYSRKARPLLADT
jgi:hypothetical protein